MKVEKYTTLCDLLFGGVFIPSNTEVLVGEFDKGYVSEVSLCNNVLAHTPIYYDDGKPLTKVHGRITDHKDLFIKSEQRHLLGLDEAMNVIKGAMEKDISYYNFWVDTLASHFNWNYSANDNVSHTEICNSNAYYFVGNLFGMKSYSIDYSIEEQSINDVREILMKNMKYFSPFNKFFTLIKSRNHQITNGFNTECIDLLEEFVNMINIFSQDYECGEPEKRIKEMYEELNIQERTGGSIFIGKLDEEMKIRIKLAEEEGLEIIHLT